MARKTKLWSRKTKSADQYADDLVTGYYNQTRFNFNKVFNPAEYAVLELNVTRLAGVAGVDAQKLCEKWYLG
jgi:hypothetical protein